MTPEEELNKLAKMIEQQKIIIAEKDTELAALRIAEMKERCERIEFGNQVHMLKSELSALRSRIAPVIAAARNFKNEFYLDDIDVEGYGTADPYWTRVGESKDMSDACDKLDKALAAWDAEEARNGTKPFTLTCVDCDAGTDVKSMVEAAKSGWSSIEETSDLMEANYIGLCPDCRRDREEEARNAVS